MSEADNYALVRNVLLHFTKVENAFHILTEGCLRFSCVTQSNDFNEVINTHRCFHGTASNGDEFIKSAQENLENLITFSRNNYHLSLSNAKILSGILITGENDSFNPELLWAHYARHDGVCLIFDRENFDQEIQKMKIRYKDLCEIESINIIYGENISRESFYEIRNSDFTFKDSKKYFSTKNSCWQYECEQKILLMNISKEKLIPQVCIFPALVGIIFGLAHKKNRNDESFIKQSNFQEIIIYNIKNKYKNDNCFIYQTDEIKGKDMNIHSITN